MQARLGPRAHVVSISLSRGCRGKRMRGGPDEHIDGVLARMIYQRGRGASVEMFETPAGQRESGGSEIDHRGRKIQLACEPGLHCVLIGRGDVCEMIGLQ